MRRIFVHLFCFALLAVAPQLARADDYAVCASKNSDDYKREDYISKAMAACSKVIDAKQRSGKALSAVYAHRAYWKHRAKQLDAALLDYDMALELDKADHELYDYRADIWFDKGNEERALAEYDQALLLKPDYLAARVSRAKIYEKRGNLEKARSEYAQVIAGKATERVGEWAQSEARARLKAMDEKQKKP
jgi:tetratricopeptide (TPR) repeat protein